MGLFIAIAVIVWLALLVSWWGLTHWFRSSDQNRMKDRLLGKEKKSVKAAAQVALFDAGQTAQGHLIPGLMKKFNLNELLRMIIEQAGLKWNPVRLVHACLAGFIAGYALAWFMLRPEFRLYALVSGAKGFAAPLIYVIRLRRK